MDIVGTETTIPRKRRHGNSTDSSIIQFAKPDFLNEEREDDSPYNSKKRNNDDDDDDSNSEPSASSDNAVSRALTWSDSPPRQPMPVQKSYERQPRRKMREEGRAEIEMAKEIARREEKKRSEKSRIVKEKEKRERKKKKQQQRRKSKEGEKSRLALGERPSNILHQAFESEHVTKDRLTVCLLPPAAVLSFKWRKRKKKIVYLCLYFFDNLN